MAESKRVRGIRGVVTVDQDRASEIYERTRALLETMITSNDVTADDIIHIMFTATSDLRSAFPATAARQMGFATTPLISAVEMQVDGSLDRCIRVLMTVYSNRTKGEIVHVYLGRAESLRPDLSGSSRPLGSAE